MSKKDRSATPPPRAMDVLSWQRPALERVQRAVTSGRLPHALLLHGPAGVGKVHFAAAIAAALLCSARGAELQACGQCAECQLTRAGSHPDLHWLQKPEDRKTISVDQVRDLGATLAMTSMRQGYRIGIIAPAHIMTGSAQNALLKTLEEPPARTLLLLVTDRPSGLLATLRSRCQRAEIPVPSTDLALSWLGGEPSVDLAEEARRRLLVFSGRAPLKALALSAHFESLEQQMCGILDALVTGGTEVTWAAEEMMGEGLPTRLDWLEKWLEATVRVRLLDDAETRLTVPGSPSLQRSAAEVNISAVFRLVDRIREAKRLLDGSAAAQLLVEALLLDFTADFAPGGTD